MANPKEVRRSFALITGASSGIGSEFARVLAANGHNLVLTARNAERLEQLAGSLRQRYGVEAVVIPADLSGPNAPRNVYDEVRRREIEVDVLINNAGFSVYGPFVETDPDSEMRMLQVNVVAVSVLTKLFARDMVARGRGRILNLGSTGSFAPAPFGSLYAASKAFVLSFSEALAEELRGTGVTVTALCPGPTRTEFAERAGMTNTKIFRGRVMSAQQVVSIGYRALMAGRTTVITGLGNNLMVWGMRFAPRALVARIAKGMMSREAPLLRAETHRA